MSKATTMSHSVFTDTFALIKLFDSKVNEYVGEVQNVHMVWLQEIQEEAKRMLSSNWRAEPELMPKTPSQKNNRRKRISLAREEASVKRRFTQGRRSNLRRNSELFETTGPKRTTRKNKHRQPKELKDEDAELASQSSCPAEGDASKQSERELVSTSPHASSTSPPQQQTSKAVVMVSAEDRRSAEMHVQAPQQEAPQQQMFKAVVRLSDEDRQAAELCVQPEPSPGRSATKIAIAASGRHRSSRRSSTRRSLVLRQSLAGLRHSMTQERLASRRSFLQKKARMANSTSSSISDDIFMAEAAEEENAAEQENAAEVLSEEPACDVPTDMGNTEVEKSPEPRPTRLTRSKAQNTPTMAALASITSNHEREPGSSGSDGSGKKATSSLRPRSKRKATEGSLSQSPIKKPSPPKKSQTTIRPAMKSFLLTVQKNQLLMSTPGTVGRSNVMKSFIKHTTPLKVELRERERQKLETLKKKQDMEEERKKKMDEEKRRKLEEMKRKRDEKLRRVVEARIKEELKDEEKKRKIEQKRVQMDEKNDKLRVERLAEEKAKKVASTKRQEELEQRRKLEEDARRKKIQMAEEEEKRLQELQAKRRVEEEQERARKLLETRRALELKKEQEKELERERRAAAERAEKAAREKERQELDEWRKREEQKQAEEARAAKLREIAKQREALAAEEARAAALREAAKRKQAEEAREAALRAARQREALVAVTSASTFNQHSLMKTPGKGPALNETVDIEHSVMQTPGNKPALNVTVDIQQSPQSYDLTPKGKPIVLSKDPEDYGMDQNSDDSTDDESAPRKPIPSWASGPNLQKANREQYYNPIDLHATFGLIEPPQLEKIFLRSKPRFFKRTSSAVWHSPPRAATNF